MPSKSEVFWKVSKSPFYMLVSKAGLGFVQWTPKFCTSSVRNGTFTSGDIRIQRSIMCIEASVQIFFVQASTDT
jgi:hypothetical protein